MRRVLGRLGRTAAVACLAVLLVVPWPGRAQMPTTIGYQGSLTDASGTPVTATLPMVFSLYDAPAAAAPLWSETQSVTVTNGVFSVRLGSVTPFPADLFTVPLYLGVKVDTDAEMTPRLPFDTAPFAFGAGRIVCATGEVLCGAVCADLANDEANCGGCGTVCPAGATCGSGACACPVGQVDCGAACADLATDAANCGACGNVCAGGEICLSGVCTPDPAADLDGDGWTVGEGDCDDTNAAVNPGATEVCNGIDDDCDGSIDESGAVGETQWFADADADSFGDPATSTFACSQPPGMVADGTDCDDTDSSVHPGAPEVCNGIDDNCSATTDEGVCVCGNAIVEPFAGEACDDGGESATCNADCSVAACGDGIVNITAGESCDDGNLIANDDCTNSCQVAACGDGILHNLGSGTEQCDDGNANANDDCTNSCQIAVCGDGILHNQGSGTEQCDDGNTVSGDGCSSTCTIE